MAKVKKKEYEKLSASNIEKVINLLEPEEPNKPITKKEACQLLNITYNTTRLQNIINEHKERVAFIATRKAQNRGKPATDLEIKQTIEEYLSGEPISAIAKRLFRSAGFIKAIIERTGIPQRPVGKEAQIGIELLPDACVSETFSPGEIIWSAQYHSPAMVKKEIKKDYEAKYNSKCYQIYVMEHVDAEDSFFPYVNKGGFFAYQLAYDLGKISHLEKYGVDLERL